LSPLDSRDMDEDVLSAAVGLDEPKPFCALNHFTVPVAPCVFHIETIELS
jgi:hypothetical protein